MNAPLPPALKAKSGQQVTQETVLKQVMNYVEVVYKLRITFGGPRGPPILKNIFGIGNPHLLAFGSRFGSPYTKFQPILLVEIAFLA